MPREYSRSRRVADLMQREIAKLIQKYIQDVEVGLITVSVVDVSPDLKNATVFFTCMENKSDIQHISELLNEYCGQFRHELSRTLTMRSVPKIRFEFDYSLDRANKLTALIESLGVSKFNSPD
jgi:ribosome-binding factor A